MLVKNLLRRKGRTLLAVLGISIGVAVIVALGALAHSLKAGYISMMAGSRADLVLSQPGTLDVSYSSVDESVGAELLAMPEVAAVSSMVQGIVQAEGNPYFFIFGYPRDSFVLTRFKISEGSGLGDHEIMRLRGKPLLLGSAAAEAMKKKPGDILRVMNSAYRVVGIYHTGNALEDGGAAVDLAAAQELLDRPRQVNLFYIRLKDLAQRQRLEARVQRLWPDLSLTGTDDLASKQMMGDTTQAMVWAVAGLAIVIGGMGMMNSQLMSVFERTREIGVLRAVGWRTGRVMAMILGEALLVSLAGGVLGLVLGWSALAALSARMSLFGTSTASIRPELLAQAGSAVLLLSLLGGAYPAWRASRLQPVEALRYEGGSGGKMRRLPLGGMAIQGLWRRTARTLLTLAGITVTVGAIMALEAEVRGLVSAMTSIALGAEAQVVIRQADISDTSFSAVDERLGEKIAAMPAVEAVEGLVFTAIALPESGSFFVLQGYEPRGFGIHRFTILDGEGLTGSRQILLGQMMAEALHKQVGDTITLGQQRFRIVGIFETGVGWEEMGGVVSLRDAQTSAGKPRKVTMYGVKVRDAGQAESVVEEINRHFPELHASLSSEFAEQTPDMQASNEIMNGISFIAIAVGGLGVMNTMLMSVLERTREIGVLRALGWRCRQVIGLILRESLLLGFLGGAAGVILALALTFSLGLIPFVGQLLMPLWQWDLFARAIAVALLLGLAGGIYPAYRATRLQPVEALRYE